MFLQSDKDTLLASANSLVSTIASIAVDAATPPPSDQQAVIDTLTAENAILKTQVQHLQSTIDAIKAALAAMIL
jgi:cell division protein FtsB